MRLVLWPFFALPLACAPTAAPVAAPPPSPTEASPCSPPAAPSPAQLDPESPPPEPFEPVTAPPPLTETPSAPADPAPPSATPSIAPELPASPRPVCVVLSVGAEQGLAHIGVLNALRERGVRVDCVIGTSMGALIGGLYASAPERDLAERYRDVFELYAGKSTRGGSAKASDLLFAVSSVWGTPRAWERMRDVLGAYLGNARIESLPVPFVTVHQRLTETGARSETVRGGLLSDEIAASIANPLLFPGMTIQRGTLLDPGLDRVSSVALETACEAFPNHQFVVSNVTPNEVFVSTRMRCPYQELRFAGVGVDRLRALTAQDSDFTRLVRAGYEKTLRELDFSRLPAARPTAAPPLEFVRVLLDVELTAAGPDGRAWDGFDGLPDIRQTTEILACSGCEPRATHAGQTRTSAGTDSRTLSADLGVLALRRGFTLRTTLVEVDVSSDDPVGTVTSTFEGVGHDTVQKLPHATVKVRFVRP